MASVVRAKAAREALRKSGSIAARVAASAGGFGGWAARIGGVVGEASIALGDTSSRRFFSAAASGKVSDGLMRAIASWDGTPSPVIMHVCGDFRLMPAKLSIAAHLREQGWKVPFSEASPGARLTPSHTEDLGFAGAAFGPKYTFVLDHMDCGRLKSRPDSSEHPINMSGEVHTKHKEGHLHLIDAEGIAYDGDACVEHSALDNRQTLIDAGFFPVNLIVDLENNEFRVWSPVKEEYCRPDDIIKQVNDDGVDPMKSYGVPPMALLATQGKILSLSESGARIEAVEAVEKERTEAVACCCGRQ